MQVFTFLWIGQLLKLSSYLMQLFFNFIALCSLSSYFCHPCKVCYALKSKPNSAVMNCAPYVPFSSHHGVKRYSSPFREERSEEHTSELQSHSDLVCRLLLEKKKKIKTS